ncbi:MAG: hypothetical protein K9J48_04050 [Desulfohalobiaceae bacterium]|nr:hypothetical protein [Desulfohalobiaceae bacterium]
MNKLLERLETLFMAAAFAEANNMKLFKLSMNGSLAEDSFESNRSRKNQNDKSKKFFGVFGKAAMQ